MDRRFRELMALFAGASILLAVPLLARGLEPATRCEVKKLKLAGRFGQCRMLASAKALQRNAAADFSTCDAKFFDKWTKVDEPECSTTGDFGRVFDDIVIHTGDLVLALDGPRFVNNGNGTISDTQTGLMWEMKDGEADGERDYSNPRDPDNFYRWTATGTAPDGDAFTSFLEPADLEELQSIVSLRNFPTIDPIFGSTARAVHWTSSTNFNDVENAWLVEFYNGTSQTGSRFGFAWVRAVRRDPPVLSQD